MIRLMKILGGMLLAASMVACGGGGGSAGTTTGSSGNTGTATASITIAIVNASGTEVSSIAIGTAYSVKATVKDALGAPVADKLVTFAINGTGLAVLNPTTALTNSSGVAQVSIAPASLNSIGASTLSVSAQVGNSALLAQKDFGVSATDISLSAVALGTSNLASGGNTSLAVTVSLGGKPATSTPVNVTFGTSCGRINGGGTSFGTTTNGSGVASAVYTAVAQDGTLCNGAVNITATSSGATPVSSVITVAPPVANAITFVSAEPAQIFVSGSGALEQSVAKFKVLTGSTPLPNVAVKFSLTVNPGGVGLNAAGSTADVSATTDADGIASVSIFSGTIPGPLRVRAALVSDASVFAETQNLTVASGPPSQRFMSLSVSTFNIEGWAIDGTATTLTVRIADRQGNPVEDGTVINFTAEGGQVATSCATAKAAGISSCSVEFRSQNPRPAGGRVSVLAYTNGTKDYVDVNGNNRYDAGTDTLVQIGDAYRDDNENATFDSGEFVIPRGGSTTCSGSGWPFPSKANTCDSSLATTVRQQTVLFYSSTVPLLTQTALTDTLISFTLASIDNPLIPMPAGTKVSVTTQDTTDGNLKSCTAGTIQGSTVPNISPGQDTTASQKTSHSIAFSGCATGDVAIVTITSPSGLATEFAFTFP